MHNFLIARKVIHRLSFEGKSIFSMCNFYAVNDDSSSFYRFSHSIKSVKRIWSTCSLHANTYTLSNVTEQMSANCMTECVRLNARARSLSNTQFSCDFFLGGTACCLFCVAGGDCMRAQQTIQLISLLSAPLNFGMKNNVFRARECNCCCSRDHFKCQH